MTRKMLYMMKTDQYRLRPKQINDSLTDEKPFLKPLFIWSLKYGNSSFILYYTLVEGL